MDIYRVIIRAQGHVMTWSTTFGPSPLEIQQLVAVTPMQDDIRPTPTQIAAATVICHQLWTMVDLESAVALAERPQDGLSHQPTGAPNATT